MPVLVSFAPVWSLAPRSAVFGDEDVTGESTPLIATQVRSWGWGWGCPETRTLTTFTPVDQPLSTGSEGLTGYVPACRWTNVPTPVPSCQVGREWTGRSAELTLPQRNAYRWQVCTGVDRCRMSMSVR